MARTSQVDVPRLCTAIRRARRVLERFRTNRARLVRQFAGPHWSGETAQDPRRPVNLLSLYVSVVKAALVSQNPRVMLSTFDARQRSAVNAMELWANAEIARSDLADTLERVALDAMFSFGVTKVHLADPGDSATAGWGLEAGQPFADPVSPDDWVYDVNARRFSHAAYMGHRYRIPKDAAVAIFGKKAKALDVSDDPRFNREGDERLSALVGRSNYGDLAEPEDMVDLWEIYVPRHQTVVTLADDYCVGGYEGDAEALWEEPWIGPPSGPYHILSFGIVPDNAMPKAPLQDLADLDEADNRLMRKLINQGERQKSLLLFQDNEDAERIQAASDGDAIRCKNPQAVQQVGFGGPDQGNTLLADLLFQRFGYMAGNLDMMGGLSPQSKTLGQDKLLAESASRAVTAMQDRTVGHTERVLRGLCWYWWNHPTKVMQAGLAVSGVKGKVPLPGVGPEHRQGPMPECQCDPYSLVHQSPQQRVAALNNVVQTVILPMQQGLAQQGVMFDADAYLSKMAKYMDMPDLTEIVTVRQPPVQGQGGGEEDQPGMPPQTSREYVRHNLPTRTNQGDSLNLRNSLLGVNPGGAQKKPIGGR